MTEKRFDLVCESNLEWLMQSILYLPLRDNKTNKRITLKQCHDLLNELQEKNKHLEKSIKRQQSSNNECIKFLDDLNDDNQHLRQALKELKKESYNNLDGLKTYKTLYFDVCEKYDNLEADFDDLKKETRELDKENEQLKQDVIYWRQAASHNYKKYIDMLRRGDIE